MGRIGKNRQEIIDAAFKILSKKGLNSFQLYYVAKAINIKSPSLYNHFKNRDDLIRSVQIVTNELLYEFMKESVKNLEGIEAFRALCHSYRNFFKINPKIHEILSISINVKDKELLAATFKPVELVSQLLPRIHMESDIGVHVMRFMRSSLYGFVSLESKGNMVLEINSDESFNLLVELITASVWEKVQKN